MRCEIGKPVYLATPPFDCPRLNMEELTTGAVKRLLNKEEVDKPVLQISGIKAIRTNSVERYRIALSDGVDHHTHVMLGADLTRMVNSNQVDKFSVVQLDKYMWYTAGNGEILVILDLTVIAKGFELDWTLRKPLVKPLASSPPFAAPVAAPFGNNSIGRLVPIAQLTPFHSRCTIRARVTHKTGVHPWRNRQGKVSKLHLLDESGEICAVLFNDDCDWFYGMIEAEKVYYISNGTVKTPQDPSYSFLDHEYELHFRSDTTIARCDDVFPSIPMLKLNLVPISNLPEIKENSIVDVIGICSWAGDVTTVKKRDTQEDLKKRDVTLVDESNVDVTLTLWGDQADSFDGAGNPVIAAKGARVTRYYGSLSVSLVRDGSLHVNPDVPESHTLLSWYKKSAPLRSLSAHSYEVLDDGKANWKCLAQAATESMGQGNTPAYYSVMACVSAINNERPLYKACPNESCNKKVFDLDSGDYLCEKCISLTKNFKWYPRIQAKLADYSGEQWITCFGEQAERLIGVPANTLGELYEESSPHQEGLLWRAFRDASTCTSSVKSDSRLEDTLEDVTFKKFIFRLHTKKDVYNDETRLQTLVDSVAPVHCAGHTRRVLERIKERAKSIKRLQHIKQHQAGICTKYIYL